MKKTFLFCAFLALLAAAAPAHKLTIKNTVGSDLDSVGDADLYAYSRETDVNGGTVTSSVFTIGDRLQLDWDSALITGRFRLEAAYQTDGDAGPSLAIAPSGFVHFTPLPQIGIAAGNSFYKHFAIPSAYLAAADDTTKHGRLLTDSLGHEQYFGTDGVAVFSNGCAGGITSDWAWGGSGQFYLKAAAGGTFYPAPGEYALDLGINFGIADVCDFGITAHNVTDAERKFGVFAGLASVPGLVLNAGFYYNFTAADYLPEARVTRSSVDKFKKQKTKYALGVTGGYSFAGIGLDVYADVIAGLTNEYIGDITYYDSDGTLVETETATIVRGGTVVKYKNGKAKRTDGFNHVAVPLYSQLRLAYQVTGRVEAALNCKVRTMLRDGSMTWLTLYPRCTVALPRKAGSVGAGVRLDMNLTRYDGISGVAMPVTYTYKFKKKF